MPDTATAGTTGLLGELREQIKDTAWNHPQFSISVGGGASSVTLEIEEDGLSVTVVGGTAPSADVSFTNSSYNTIEKVVRYLQSLGGYNVEFTESGDPRHASTDLARQAPTSILNTGYVARTRRWSDAELTSLLTNAMRRHNSSVPHMVQLNYTGDYTFDTIPEKHKYFIILLAQIEMLKTLISDASKRRGTDLNVADYDTWKRSLEDEYASALDRLIKGAESTPPVELTEIDQGDVVIGHSYRTRLRPAYPHFNRVIPSQIAPMPKASTITAIHEEDGVVLLEWSRNRDMNFYKYEVWRGETDEVSNRSRTITPVNIITFDGALVHTQSLQYKTTFIDGTVTPLDPGLYYYRVYVYNMNGEYVGSQPVSIEIPA